jgi:hypothetical protein
MANSQHTCLLKILKSYNPTIKGLKEPCRKIRYKHTDPKSWFCGVHNGIFLRCFNAFHPKTKKKIRKEKKERKKKKNFEGENFKNANFGI